MTNTAQITVRRSAQNFGPYSLKQVNSMLAAGRLSDLDFAWVEGAPEWQALGSVPGILRVPPIAMPVRSATESERLVLPALLLALFLGVFGVHRFYVGKVGSGIWMLLLTLSIVGAIVSGIWYIVDTVVIACGSFTDGEGKRVRRWV